MDAVTREALEASIEAWQIKVDAAEPEDVILGYDGCPLCQEFRHPFCNGCPVRDKTGKAECKDTPYFRALIAFERWDKKPTDNKSYIDWQAAAQAEVDFLKSLRPVEP